MPSRRTHSRRDFLALSAAAAAATPLLPLEASTAPSDMVGSGLQRQMTIQEVVDTIIAAIPGAPRDETVDTIKIGDPSAHVTGVATTFLATSDVIERASRRGANLIITHEPTFYNHLDQTDWLADDPVYDAKVALAAERGVVVWRFHDYWHLVEPDGILTGMLRRLGWEDAPVSASDRADMPSICEIEPMTLLALADHFKTRLGIPHRLRAVGDPSMACRRIGLLLGAYGGRNQMAFLRDAEVDVLVIGEVPEWETNIYVSDARTAGMNLALLELGHSYSEEPGMEWLVDWLQPKLTAVPVFHVPTGDVFIRI